MIDKTDLFEKYKKLNITDPYNERLLFLSENEKFNKVVKKLREKFNIPLVGLKEESQQTFKEILFPKDKKHQGWRKEIEKELIQKLKIPLGKYKELFTRIVVWHYLYNDFYPLPKVLQESETGKIKPLPIAPVVSKLGDTIRVSFFIDYNTQKTKAKKFIQRYLDENWNKIGKIQKTISINNKRVVYQQSTKVPKDLKSFVEIENIDADYAKFFLKCFDLKRNIESQYQNPVTNRQLDNILIEVANNKILKEEIE